MCKDGVDLEHLLVGRLFGPMTAAVKDPGTEGP